MTMVFENMCVCCFLRIQYAWVALIDLLFACFVYCLYMYILMSDLKAPKLLYFFFCFFPTLSKAYCIIVLHCTVLFGIGFSQI